MVIDLYMKFSVTENPALSRQIWAFLVATVVFMSKLESDSVISPSLHSRMVHPTAHLISFPSDSPQTHEDNFILPEILFSHTTLLKSPLSVLRAFRGPPRFLDPKGMTSNDINMPGTDSGEGAGPHENLANVAP